ncbi:4377_t:CDS:10, partial [Acaulospora morrowiae]
TVERVNNDIAQQIHELVKTDFFKYYKLNLYKECPFWTENGQCINRACAVETTDEAISSSRVVAQQRSCDQDFCVVEDEADVEGVYVNLHDNPERFTGYAGASAGRVWKAIYEENCFNYHSRDSDQPSKNKFTGLFQSISEKPEATGGEACFEKRVYYKLISGLHSSISIHICDEYLNQTTGQWGPNLDCFISRFGSHPERIQNAYFTYVVLLRSISKMSEYLRGYKFCTGDEIQDAEVKEMVGRLVNTAESCPGTFDERQMFSSPQSRLLKEEFKAHFRNVSRIMDCVGCEKCRLWGKLQTSGLGTALKVLFSYDDEYFNPKVHPNLLTRTEIVALFNTFNRFSESLQAIERFRQMYQQRIDDLKVVGSHVSTRMPDPESIETPPIVITKPLNVTNETTNHFPETGFLIDLLISIKEMISPHAMRIYSMVLQKLEQWHIPIPVSL